jgi:hypothetical protein
MVATPTNTFWHSLPDHVKKAEGISERIRTVATEYISASGFDHRQSTEVEHILAVVADELQKVVILNLTCCVNGVLLAEHLARTRDQLTLQGERQAVEWIMASLRRFAKRLHNEVKQHSKRFADEMGFAVRVWNNLSSSSRDQYTEELNLACNNLLLWTGEDKELLNWKLGDRLVRALYVKFEERLKPLIVSEYTASHYEAMADELYKEICAIPATLERLKEFAESVQ